MIRIPNFPISQTQLSAIALFFQENLGNNLIMNVLKKHIKKAINKYNMAQNEFALLLQMTQKYRER